MAGSPGLAGPGEVADQLSPYIRGLSARPFDIPIAARYSLVTPPTAPVTAMR